jgi:hypothetical protein
VVAINGAEEVTSPLAPAPPARFEILTEAQLTQVAEIRKLSGNSSLALSIQLAQLGLREDAVTALERLRHENPGSALIQRLLDSLQRP